jgi:indolepyruvate ferredoxin oxidoreductase beta subunit
MTTEQRSTSSTTNVLITGVGGQGVIMVSKVLALLCQMNGLSVKQSEVHGMAKRGGSVFSHVRFGPQVWSPTIPKGSADILLALEWAEAMRWLPHMNPQTGTFIADTQHIVPPFAFLDRSHGAEKAYARETPKEIIGKVERGFALDAGTMARKLGNARAANTVLLGVLSTALDFGVDEWQEVIARFVPPRTREVNEQAFLAGREWTEKAEIPAQAPPRPLAAHEKQVDIDLRIETKWCKGCDICVKMCPERCLVLNEEQKAVMARPEACTGCRLCEWLCPDFAITVTKTRQPSEMAGA